MRIRWRGLELPGRVVPDSEVNSDSYGRFKVEPFEQGFGTTIGNSLRRVLLSCLEGAAVTTVKIEGVAHEFATIDGVFQDVTDILLNVKGIILKMDGQDPKTMSLERDTAGDIKAGEAHVAVTALEHSAKLMAKTAAATKKEAEKLASLPLVSLLQTKALMMAPHINAMKAANIAENEALLSLRGGPANVEAVSAFREKREPNFSNS